MKIELEIVAGKMFIVFKNNTPSDVRIWQPDNSWGWENLSFIVRAKSGSSPINITRAATTGWTKNGPGYFDIPAGQQVSFHVQLSGKSWEADQDYSKLKDETVSIKALYNITDTSDAKELNIWIGKAESKWLRVHPPHNWLFAAN